MASRRRKAGRSYRTKIEVLRDFLVATRLGQRKTRIIGTANLNRRSFIRYADFCLERGLIVSRSGGYALTPQADKCIETIDEFLAVRSELSLALDSLDRATRNHLATSGNGTGSKPPVGNPAWIPRSDFLDLDLRRGSVSGDQTPAVPPQTSRAK